MRFSILLLVLFLPAMAMAGPTLADTPDVPGIHADTGPCAILEAPADLMVMEVANRDDVVAIDSIGDETLDAMATDDCDGTTSSTAIYDDPARLETNCMCTSYIEMKTTSEVASGICESFDAGRGMTDTGVYHGVTYSVSEVAPVPSACDLASNDRTSRTPDLTKRSLASI